MRIWTENLNFRKKSQRDSTRTTRTFDYKLLMKRCDSEEMLHATTSRNRSIALNINRNNISTLVKKQLRDHVTTIVTKEDN